MTYGRGSGPGSEWARVNAGPRVALLAAAITAGGCLHARPAGLEAVRDPLLLRRMPALGERLGDGVDSAHALVLSYRTSTLGSRWTWEIVVGRRFYAERRSRVGDRARYAFGEDGRGAWLETNGLARTADTTWRAEARTRAAVFGLRFLHPGVGDDADLVDESGDAWDYAYRPVGGRTITLRIDATDGRPASWDSQDAFQRLVTCDALVWDERDGHQVPVSGTCRAGGCSTRACAPPSTFELVDADEVDVEDAPSWARPRERRAGAGPFVEVLSHPIEERTAVTLDAEVDGLPPVPLVLDSGAFHTTLSRDVAAALGVVPTGETALFLEPPWLPEASAEIGVLPHAKIGGMEVDGMRVLVAESATDVPFVGGLVGADFFRRAVVDIDSPNRVVRLVPRERFERTTDAYPLRLLAPLTHTPYVLGEVLGVDEGLIVLDTGASLDIVVHSPRMSSIHPRRPGTGIVLGALTDLTRSADYLSEIDGLRIGPFPFPAMPAVGRDRERERIGEGIALVGMGLMRHFRLAFDMRDGLVYASPGPSYGALVRAGLELEDDGSEVRLAKILPRGSADAAGLREGDVLLEVAGRRLARAEAAESALADARGGRARMRVRREDRERIVTIALDPGWEDPRSPSWDWVR